VRAGRKFDQFFCLLAVVTWFLNFLQITHLSINHIQEDTFMPNLVQIGQETAESWRKQNKIKKSREKQIITGIGKSCIFAKWQYNETYFRFQRSQM